MLAMRRKIVLGALALAVMVAGWASPARADRIDFVGLSGGTLSFNPAVGNSLSVSGAPLNFLTLASSSPALVAVTNGSLSLTSGSALSIDTTTLPGFTIAVFGPGGNVTLVGGVPSLGIADGTTLATGSFQGALALMPSSFGGGWTVSSLYSGLITGLGFAPDAGIGLGSLSLSLFSQFDQGVWSGSLNSSNVAVPIPVPATLLLFGLGLLIAAGFLRKKSSAA